MKELIDRGCEKPTDQKRTCEPVKCLQCDMIPEVQIAL